MTKIHILLRWADAIGNVNIIYRVWRISLIADKA